MQSVADRKLLNRDLWVVFFIYVSVFINSLVFFQSPFEFYLGYLIYLLLLPVFMARYGFQRPLFFIFLLLAFSGLFHVFQGNNTPQQFFKILFGLSLSYFFYQYVIQEFNYNCEQLFKWYLKGAFIVSLIGLVQFISFQVEFRAGYDYSWLFNKWGVIVGGMFGIRVNSVFGEPTHLGAVVSAAFFVSVYNLLIKETFYLSKFQSSIIIVVYILSFSGLGQVGIFLTLILLAINFGLVRYLLIFIPIGILLFTYMHDNVPEFRDRFDSLIGLFSGGKFELGKTHGSSFILYNNFVVATENFKENFMFGTGLGSHPTAFAKYTTAAHIGVYGFNLNSADANSMLLRLISETGLFGTGIMLFILFKFYVPRDIGNTSNHWLISNGILIMILLNLFRQGHYFLNGFPFFVLLYIYNYYSYHTPPDQKIESSAEVKDPQKAIESR